MSTDFNASTNAITVASLIEKDTLELEYLPHLDGVLREFLTIECSEDHSGDTLSNTSPVSKVKECGDEKFPTTNPEDNFICVVIIVFF